MRITEDTLHLDAATLETVPIRPGEPIPSYPFPALRLSGAKAPMAFRVVVLENAWVRVTISLDLGGRILDIHDRRTGIDILGRVTEVSPETGGRRGAFVKQGIQLIAGEFDRAGAMAPMEYQIRDEDDHSPTLILHEITSDRGLSTHLSYSLDADQPILRVAVRMQNITLQARSGHLGLWFPFESEALYTESGVGFYDQSRDAGVTLISPSGEVEQVATQMRGQSVLTWSAPLAPWETVSAEFNLIPVSGLGELSAFSDIGALGVTDEFIRLQAHRPLEGERLYLLSREGETLEAPLDLAPPVPFIARREGSISEPEQIALLSTLREEVLRWPPSILELQPPQEVSRSGRELRFEKAALAFDLDDATLRTTGKERSLAATALILRAGKAARREDYAEAMDLLDMALERDAQNVLAWWFKAVVRRKWSEGGDETPELMNAHFLSPLDPVLRAEAFLSQSSMMGADPSAIVAPLAHDPEALILPAVLLIEFGLDDEAARWIDEALRHRDEPRLRILLAWRLIEDSRMEVEAVQHLQRIASASIQPPFPWHAAERYALEFLSSRFPDMVFLGTLALLANENLWTSKF